MSDVLRNALERILATKPVMGIDPKAKVGDATAEWNVHVIARNALAATPAPRKPETYFDQVTRRLHEDRRASLRNAVVLTAEILGPMLAATPDLQCADGADWTAIAQDLLDQHLTPFLARHPEATP